MQLPEKSASAIPSKDVDLIGGGGWTRTNDLRIMSRPAATDSKELQQLPSADSGKVLQNPQPPRNQSSPPDVAPPRSDKSPENTDDR